MKCTDTVLPLLIKNEFYDEWFSVLIILVRELFQI